MSSPFRKKPRRGGEKGNPPPKNTQKPPKKRFSKKRNKNFKKGLDKILKKIGEEASETIIAAKNGDKKETVGEICDLLFHMEVMMAELGLDWNDITEELNARREKENMNIEKEAKRKAENRTDECKIN